MRNKWKITNCPAPDTQQNLKAGMKSRGRKFAREHKEYVAMHVDMSGFLVIYSTQSCHLVCEQKGQRWRTLLNSHLPQIVLQPLLKLTEICYCSACVNKPGNISKTFPAKIVFVVVVIVELLFQFCQSHCLPLWRMGYELIKFFFP